MADSIYTKPRHAQWRGPTTSDDVNARVEENYKDLVLLYNKLGLSDEDVRRAFQRLLKDQFAMVKALEDQESRIKTLEAGVNKLTFGGATQIDNARFDGTPFEVATVNRLTHDDQHGVFTLPLVESSSLSKVKFTNTDGTTIVPSSFEALVVGDTASADSSGAIIDTSDLYHSVLTETGKVWQRNVIVDAPHANGASLSLYVRLPTDLSVVENTNNIIVHPFPSMGCDVMGVEYSTKGDIVLNDTDDYTPINYLDFHQGNTAAVGWTPPGAWAGDEIVNSGPKAFYFDPKPVTGLKIKLRQRHYFKEGNKFIYSYGLSRLDARYEKFLETGKAIIRFDAKVGETISSLSGVNPQVFNISEGEAASTYSYRVIWETALNSGTYTLTPVPLSTRVWVEVTLNKTLGKGSPALSGLTISYS